MPAVPPFPFPFSQFASRRVDPMKRHFPFAVLATAALLTIAGCGTQVVLR